MPHRNFAEKMKYATIKIMSYLIKIIAIFALLALTGCKLNTSSDLRSPKNGAEALPTTAPTVIPDTQTSPSPAPKTFAQMLELLPILLTAGRIQALSMLSDKPDLKPLVEEIFNYLIDNIKLLTSDRDPAKSAEEFVAILKKWVKPPMTDAEVATARTSVTAAFTELQALAKKSPPPPFSELLAVSLKVVKAIPGETGIQLQKVMSVEAIQAFITNNPNNEIFIGLLKTLNVNPLDLIELLKNQ